MRKRLEQPHTILIPLATQSQLNCTCSSKERCMNRTEEREYREHGRIFDLCRIQTMFDTLSEGKTNNTPSNITKKRCINRYGLLVGIGTKTPSSEQQQQCTF